nr:GH92 family glycosyl hydrolase [Nakamurella aerolata]
MSASRTAKSHTRSRPARRVAVLAAVALLAPMLPVPAQAAAVARPVADPLPYVDPMIGTTNLGNTYPGATTPFGMISWSPTGSNGDQTSTPAANGYDYNTPRLRGFSLTHVNGAGCSVGAQGDLPIMPISRDVTSSPSADVKDAVYAAGFDHADESATPGRYRVDLDNGVRTDAAAARRSAVVTFQFPQGKPANLLFRTSNSFNGSEDADISIDAATGTVSGSVLTGAFCGRRANGGTNNRVSYYRLYFTARLDKPITETGTWKDGTLTPGGTRASGGEGYATGADRAGRGSGGWVGFDTGSAAAADRTVTMRIGLSYTSAAAAEQNLTAEIPRSRSLASVAATAATSWRRQLSTVRISGGSQAQRTTFYTALYHVFQQPNLMSDASGSYLGADKKVHQVGRYQREQYSNFSGWDQYRAQTQLLALLNPSVASDFAQSLSNLAAQSGGIWDRWVLANAATHVMTGDPSAPTLAGMYAFGARGFDVTAAFDSLVRQATVPNAQNRDTAGCPGQCVAQRGALEDYLRLLYAPNDACACWGGAAETLENSVADYALADWAQRLGRNDVAARLLPRASWWKNTFNPKATPAAGYQQARNADGSWVAPFDPNTQTGFAQGSAATYTLMVPQDVSGLSTLLGGDAATAARLDDFFRNPDGSWATRGGTRYDPTNEPGIHTPWMYNAIGMPWKTQQTVRAYASGVYGPGTGGLPGNDDLGTMSAWYVFAALGIYPQNPARADLLLAAPLFPKAVIARPSGQRIQIDAPNTSADNQYIQSATVNGAGTTRSWLDESMVQRGGTVSLTLGPTPNTGWGSAPADRPVDHVG